VPVQVALREAVQSGAATHEVGHRLGFNLALGTREAAPIGPPVGLRAAEVPAEEMRHLMGEGGVLLLGGVYSR
jgi:hypothetical protein